MLGATTNGVQGTIYEVRIQTITGTASPVLDFIFAQCPRTLFFLVHKESARSCLPFLVAHLASTGHSCHHVLLLEIKRLTDAFAAILGPNGQDIFHLSNSFMVMAKLLARQLDMNEVRGDK